MDCIVHGVAESQTRLSYFRPLLYTRLIGLKGKAGYFAHAFEELGAWLWKRPGMHIVVVGNIKHKEIPESKGHQGSLLMGNSASGEA